MAQKSHLYVTRGLRFYFTEIPQHVTLI